MFNITTNVLLYGANGYTGKLVLDQLLKLNLKPILAGRNLEDVKKLAESNNLEYRIFALHSHEEIVNGLQDIQILLNCAGPFIKTIKPFLKACLENKVHYFDITGEIDVFNIAHSFDQEAKERGVIICPGVGFDVVPTDCLALMLKEQFEGEPINLELAFHGQGGPSKGTALTSLGGSGSGTKVRRNGQIVTLPYSSLYKEVNFPHKKMTVNSIPWGDIFTSYISTGIPNVTVYMAMSPKTIKRMKRVQKFFFLRNFQPFKYFVQRNVKKSIPAGGGPSEETRKKSKGYIWGSISDKNNEHTLEMFLVTPNGYTLTALSSAMILNKFDTIDTKRGFFTPSQLMGSGFVLEIPGTELIKK